MYHSSGTNTNCDLVLARGHGYNYRTFRNIEETYKELTYGDFTFNENAKWSQKKCNIFFDLDNISNEKQGDKITKEVQKVVASLIGHHKMNIYFNTKSHNRHLIFEAYTEWKYINAIHHLARDIIGEEHIDPSVGIRTIFCKKQITNGKYVVSFDDNYYHLKGETMPLNNKWRAEHIYKHSIYNLKNKEEAKITDEIRMKMWWINRRHLTSDEINEVKQVQGNLFKPKEWGQDEMDDIYEVSRFKFCGKIFDITIDLCKNIFKAIPSYFANIKNNWFLVLYSLRGVKNIYKAFDEFSKKSEGYNVDNNLKLWEGCIKMLPFKTLVNVAKRYSKTKLLKAFGLTAFDYDLFKAQKFNKGYDHRTYDGRTRPLNTVTEIIQSNMGTGKTSMLSSWLDERTEESVLGPSVLLRDSVLILTAKRTLADSSMLRFNGFVDYRDSQGDIYDDRVVVQLESLIRVKRHYDVLIIDEAHELFKQINSGFHPDMVLLKEHFKKIMKTPVIKFLDANITPMVLSILKAWDIKPTWNHNLLKVRKDENIFLEDEGDFKSKFSKAVDDGLRVFLPSNNITILEQAEQLCITKNVKYMLIYSKSKKESNINELLKDVQVFLFSPTLTAGLDIQKEFDIGFCWFNNSCNGPQSCNQMAGRVRNIKQEKIYYYLDIDHSHLPIANFETFMKYRFDFGGVNKLLNDNFETVYEKGPWYESLLAIKLDEHVGHNKFRQLLFEGILRSGGTITQECTETKSVDFMNAEVALLGRKADEFNKTEVITPDEYINMAAKTSHTRKENAMIEKHEMLKVYDKIDLMHLAEHKKWMPQYLNLHSASDNEASDTREKRMMKGVKGVATCLEILSLVFDEPVERGIDVPFKPISGTVILSRLEPSRSRLKPISAIFSKTAPPWVYQKVIRWMSGILREVFGMTFITMRTHTGQNTPCNRCTYILRYVAGIDKLID
jgi:hypothetical protein